MPRIAIADGPGTVHERMYRQLRPELGKASLAMALAAYRDSILPVRVREAVRYRIALINGCLICQSARPEDAANEGFDDALYRDLEQHGTSSRLDERERVAVEFAERFALAHETIDDDLWAMMRAHFTDAEVLDLAFVTARHLAFGRLTHVLGLDDSCEIVDAADASMGHLLGT